MLAVWLRGAASAGAPGEASLGRAVRAGLAGALCLSAAGAAAAEEACAALGAFAALGAYAVLGGAFLMPTVVQEPLSGEPPSAAPISGDTENASAAHAGIVHHAHMQLCKGMRASSGNACSRSYLRRQSSHVSREAHISFAECALFS